MLDFDKIFAGELGAVYRIFGDDLFVMERACYEIEKKCNNHLGDMNKTFFNDENFNAENLISICDQIPMLAEKRFVLVKNIAKISESDLKILNEYCKNPSPDCVLVFCELPNQNLFKKLNAQQIECKKLSELELRKIIETDLLEYGKKIATDACTLLINFCVKDLMLIKNEIFKLGFYKVNLSHANAENIDVDDVKKMVYQNDDYNIFEISEALTKGKGDRAIVLLKKMLETMDFSAVLGLVSSHFRRMYYSMISAGTDLEIAEQLGVKPFAVTKAKSSSRHLKPMQIARINSLILEVDYFIKDGKMNFENAMYYLVFGISIITQEKI